MINAFSVDVEDWYHGIELPFEKWDTCSARLEIGLYRILDLLQRHGIYGTFFVLGWVCKQHPALVKEIARHGHELGSHGSSHQKVYYLSPEAFRQEIKITRKMLQDLSGQAVTVHRSPFFSITSENLWALDILRTEGITIDCSISPVKTWRYGIDTCPDEILRLKDVGIVEFPVSHFRILKKKWAIGGAYFRILPYQFTKKAILKKKSKKKSTMFYIHPWECDPSHPVVPMEWKAKLTHYTCLRKTMSNLERLLRDFRFGTVSQAVKSYENNHAFREVTSDLLKD